MALGKRKDAANFMPVAKYDARIGRFTLVDRVYTDSWNTVAHDVTANFEAIFDLGTIQRGWLLFPKNAAPEMTLVPAGMDPGDPPSDEHREGLRLLLKMAGSIDGSVRELLSTAVTLWNAIDVLHDQYLAGLPEHPDRLPVVTIAEIKETKTKNGTAFTPVFRIKSWAPRPADLSDSNVRVLNGKSAKPRPPTAEELSEIPF